jgi:16S rRNA A1518/A1519 N6-dimethyltransferase RsmA/KsgA/DIM1 with predicted DNA glycosylase/AP lyase activity
LLAMIELAEITATNVVLDLGAGRGAITMPLAEQAGKVLAIENDAAFVTVFDQLHPTQKTFHILASRGLYFHDEFSHMIIRIEGILEQFSFGEQTNS